MNEYLLGTEKYCVYGSHHTPDTVYIYGTWYVVDGSVNVNMTQNEEEFERCLVNYNIRYEDENYIGKEGYIDVELIQDIDTITASHPINSLDELINLIDYDEDEEDEEEENE